MKEMKWRSVISACLGLLAVLLAAAAVFLVITFRDAKPVLLYVPEEVSLRVEEMMDAICCGDFSSAAKRMYGNPDLGIDRESEDPVNRAFWNAFVSSLDYELVGEPYATQSGIAQDVKIISLELSTATEKLGARAEALLQQGLAQAENASEVYDGANYKESFVESVIQQAAQQALEEDVRYSYNVVTLQLVCSDGQWWIMPDKALLSAISGGTVG